MPVKQTFASETIELDGKEYVGCVFDHCTIIFRGGALPRLQNNRFDECKWEFHDAAERTVQFMSLLYQGGGAKMVEGTFEGIRSGNLGR